MIINRQLYKGSVTILQKRAFSSTHANEVDKKEKGKMYDTTSQKSHEEGKVEQVNEGSEKAEFSDDTVSSKDGSEDSIFDKLVEKAIFNSKRDTHKSVSDNGAGPSKWEEGSSGAVTPITSEDIRQVRRARARIALRERVFDKLKTGEDIRGELSIDEGSQINVESDSGIGQRSPYSDVFIRKAP